MVYIYYTIRTRFIFAPLSLSRSSRRTHSHTHVHELDATRWRGARASTFSSLRRGRLYRAHCTRWRGRGERASVPSPISAHTHTHTLDVAVASKRSKPILCSAHMHRTTSCVCRYLCSCTESRAHHRRRRWRRTRVARVSRERAVQAFFKPRARGQKVYNVPSECEEI